MKMTGWQTRLTFPVIPNEQWEFPTLPPEPDKSYNSSKIRSDSENSSSSSLKRKGKEKEVIIKTEELPQKLRRKSKPRPKRTTVGSRTPNVGIRHSNAQQQQQEVIPPATPIQVLNTNQNEDDELVYIKSEETEETMPSILPDPENQNFYCRACNLQKSSRATYRYHLKHFHKMQLTALQPPRSNINTVELPNLYDPHFYCRNCKKKYKDIVSYKRHCINHHGMQFTRVMAIPDPTVIPDPDDPLHHCKACNRNYEVRSTFREHLRRVHKMTLEPACNPANLDRSKGFVCRFCNETFDQGKVYGAHLQANHQGKLEKR